MKIINCWGFYTEDVEAVVIYSQFLYRFHCFGAIYICNFLSNDWFMIIIVFLWSMDACCIKARILTIGLPFSVQSILSSLWFYLECVVYNLTCIFHIFHFINYCSFMLLFIVLKLILIFALYRPSYLNDYLYDFSTINLILCAGNHLHVYDYGKVISKTYIYVHCFVVIQLWLLCSFQDCFQ